MSEQWNCIIRVCQTSNVMLQLCSRDDVSLTTFSSYYITSNLLSSNNLFYFSHFHFKLKLFTILSDCFYPASQKWKLSQTLVRIDPLNCHFHHYIHIQRERDKRRSFRIGSFSCCCCSQPSLSFISCRLFFLLLLCIHRAELLFSQVNRVLKRGETERKGKCIVNKSPRMDGWMLRITLDRGEKEVFPFIH